AAAAEPEREEIGHAEERAYAADLDDVVRLAGETVAERTDVGGGAADVHHERVGQTRQERGAAHAVGRSRGERVDGVRLGDLGQHHGAVVLGEVQRRVDAAGAQRVGEGARG